MISVFSVLGYISSLIVDIVIAAWFGLGSETDAFFIAFTTPRLGSSMLMVAIRSAIVPIFSRIIDEQGKPGLWRTSSNLMNLSLLALGALGMVGFLGAPLLIWVLGAGLDDSTQSLAVVLCKIVFWIVVPLGIGEICKATLNSLRRFAFPAAAQLVWNIPVLVVVVLFGRSFGIRSLAWGYVIGAWIQLIFLAAALLMQGFQYRPILQWREPWTAKALLQIRHPLASAVLSQSNIFLERSLASFLPAGLVSALAFARRMYGAIDTIFLGSVSTAFLPRLSTQFEQNIMLAFKQSLSLGLRLTIFISAPLTVGIVVLSQPIVQLLFQRGAFDQETTRATAQLLSIYIWSIPPMALRQMFMTSYYAAMDVKTPFYIAMAMLALNAVLDLTLFSLMGAVGLALAVPVTRMITTALLAWLLYRRIGSFGPGLVSFAVKISLAAAIMGGLVLGLQGAVFENLGHGGLLGSALRVFVSAAIGVGVYALLLLVLRVKETEKVMQIVKSRLNKVGTLPG
jgi:putative peptidoglycan lipid II flippase